MKKRFFAVSLLLCMIIMLTSVITPVTANSKGTSKEEKVRNTRFLNMLNHNFVYNEDFDDVEKIVNNSVLAIVSQQKSKPEYVEENIVCGFVKDMYGIEKIDTSLLNTKFPQKQGYIFVIPKGYTVYKHKIISVTLNEDGTYLVTTQISVDTHDCNTETLKAVTLFAKNENSSFGYNIVYSDILEDGNNV